MRLFMAPMEGVVDHHLRELYSSLGGIDIFVTEFIRVTHTRLPNKVFKKRCPELITPLPQPVRVQLLGSDPKSLALNAKTAANLGATAIDLNFGCPAKTVNRHRGGACLLNDTPLISDIVHNVRMAIPDTVAVTAKIRLGFEERNTYLLNARAIQEAGANEICVHARSKTDGYKPPAYWDCIHEIQEQLVIPVIANGEIWNLDDYKRCKSISGCKDFMLGRGLLANPGLANEIKAYETNQTFTSLTWDSMLAILKGFYLSTRDQYPDKYCGNRLKQWLVYLKRHYPEAQAFFDIIKTKRTKAELDATFH